MFAYSMVTTTVANIASTRAECDRSSMFVRDRRSHSGKNAADGIDIAIDRKAKRRMRPRFFASRTHRCGGYLAIGDSEPRSSTFHSTVAQGQGTKRNLRSASPTAASYQVNDQRSRFRAAAPVRMRPARGRVRLLQIQQTRRSTA